MKNAGDEQVNLQFQQKRHQEIYVFNLKRLSPSPPHNTGFPQKIRYYQFITCSLGIDPPPNSVIPFRVESFNLR